MKEKGKKIITLSIILFMVLNYLLPLVNYAEFNLCSVKDVIVKGLDENQEEIGREYEIKETEEWDISENGDGKVIAKWNFEDKSLTITGTGKMKDWEYNSVSDWHKKYYRIIEKIVIENGVTDIGEFAFYYCKNLTSVNIPESVVRIGSFAFYQCINLTSTTIPNSETSIEESTYYGCSSLTNVEIPNNVTSIEQSAFYGCSSLKKIIIPSGVIDISDNVFNECNNLTEINVSDNNKQYASIDGVLYNKEQTEIIRYPLNKNEKEYNIPNSVTTIRNHAFYGCRNLTKITIPKSVTSIRESAFGKCDSLKEITIPDSVTNIESYAFYRCSSLINLTIPNSITSISGAVFEECRSLASITIPESVTSIGGDAFNECRSLTNITIPESVTSIGMYAFREVKRIICKTNSSAHKYAEENKVNYILSDNVASNYTTEYQIKEIEEWDVSEKGDRSVIAKWKLEDRSVTISGIGKMKGWNNRFKIDWNRLYNNIIDKLIFE